MGMECRIEFRVKLSSGRTLVDETTCLWYKNWTIAEKILGILGESYGYNDGGEYEVNRGELQEIYDLLLKIPEDKDAINQATYPGEYISNCYLHASELKKIMLLREKKLALYDIFISELEDNYDPDDNIIETKVIFIYSP